MATSCRVLAMPVIACSVRAERSLVTTDGWQRSALNIRDDRQLAKPLNRGYRRPGRRDRVATARDTLAPLYVSMPRRRITR